MISPLSYPAYVDATVGRGGSDDVPVGWAFVWVFYCFTPVSVIILIIALFMTLTEKISNIPSSDN